MYNRTQSGGFQFLLILGLWGISFHAEIVFGLGKNLFFKSVLGHCVQSKVRGRFRKNFWPSQNI